MKNFTTHILAAGVCCALLLTGCSKESDNITPNKTADVVTRSDAAPAGIFVETGNVADLISYEFLGITAGGTVPATMTRWMLTGNGTYFVAYVGQIPDPALFPAERTETYKTYHHQGLRRIFHMHCVTNKDGSFRLNGESKTSDSFDAL